ncbi:MAG: DUF5318 family protein [Actinomycetota bacterium]
MHGFIDYTLAKRAVLDGFKRGAVDAHDICDAHPELMRAARNIGEALLRPCPVCSAGELKQVRYVFGDQLKRLSGQPVYPSDMDVVLSRKVDEFRCYAIEVCVDCGWNHMSSCYLLGRRFSDGENPQDPEARQKRRKSRVQ